ncbi:LITAF-like zinc ribbon domain-containing protein [Ditylenchus destructor]|uniref:LITAF-like zinc ribbon domain-containing protein n=1 Tax=Ditylenchus destructor TaxID=166010 RepID=A0AAD4N0Y6_9BILA|nr:LITAF-like zinc ribbon domain-containing protein [Ditylenchus destructor]
MSAYPKLPSYEELPKAPYPSVIPPAPRSMRVTCPSCHQEVKTVISKDPGLVAFLSCAFMCMLGLVLCACLPCCMEGCQDVTHNCPKCGSYLGKYKAYLD